MRKTTLSRLIVRRRAGNPRQGWLSAGALALPVAIGRGGIKANKREGDGGTPRGAFRLKRLWWRADRHPRPETLLPSRPIRPRDMSKIEAGRIRLDFEDLALDSLLSETMRVVSARAEEKQLIVTSRISPDLQLRADRRALKQIMLNLLSNAVKFTPAGGNITVRGRASGECIVLAIADTGIGIAKDALTRLGRPFEQVESQLTKSHQGSGLGLAISKSLVALHGGSMRIRSTLGKGTLVLVRLPLEPHCALPKEEAA